MSAASLISDRFRELARKTGVLKHTPAVGLDAATTTKILQLSFVGVIFCFVPFTPWHRVPHAHISYVEINVMLCTQCHYVNGYHFYNVNKNQRKFPQRAVQRTTEFCEFCANGKRPAFIGVGSERDKTEAKRG